MDDNISKHIVAIQQRALRLVHLLDTQGSLALIAHVLHREDCLQGDRAEFGLSPFGEDQIFAVLLSGSHYVEEVVLCSDAESTSALDAVKPGRST
jgi:hypothetical protein